MALAHPSRPRPHQPACCVLAALCVLLALLPQPAGAADVVLLVADRLERADVWDSPGPNLARLCGDATVGLVCVRFLLSGLPESAYVSLGAGSWVQYEGSERWRGGGEPADVAAFRVDTGLALPPGALYCRERERVSLYSNEDARPGALGDALHAAGKRTACIGNADLPPVPRRQILSLMMDGRGVVDLGDVGPSTLAADATAPGGARVDVAATVRAFDRVAPRAEVVAVEFGDTSRLAACRRDLSPAAFAKARRAALARLDHLIGALRSRIDPGKTVFVLVSPAPPVAPSATEQVLTPLLVAGRDWPPGLLSSATTRRAGLAASGDVSATLAALLGAGALPDGSGSILGTMPAPDAGEQLRRLDERTRRVARLRFGAFQVWAVLLAPGVGVAPLLLALRALRGRPAAVGVVRAARGVQLCALSLPAAGVLVSGFPAASLGEYALRLATGVAVVAAAAGILGRLARAVPAPAWIAAGTLAALALDVSQGSWRILGGMVSYALTEGARYYGIGNEMMGIAIGLALVGVAAVHPWCRARTPALALAAAAGLSVGIGYSGLGANFGGGLTSAFALVAAAVCLGGWGGPRAVLAPALALLVSGAALVGMDLARGPEMMSHVGRAALHAGSAGPGWVADLVARKAHMNEVLMGRTGAIRLFFMALPVLLAFGLRPPASVPLGRPGVRPLLLSGVVGSVAALLLNDSGVVAGGLMLAFVVVGAGYLALSEDPRNGGRDCASWQ